MTVTTADGYEISTDKTRLNLALIHQYLSTASYWAKDIPLELVQISIDGSFCFGLYSNKQQIGFARVITDFATFGYLADVFILPEQQGKGLSKLLMEHIMGHPQLQGFRRWMLATRDAHGLYSQFGFVPLPHPERIMLQQSLTGYAPVPDDKNK